MRFSASLGSRGHQLADSSGLARVGPGADDKGIFNVGFTSVGPRAGGGTRRTAAGVLEAFNHQPWLYAGADIIAQDMASIRWHLYRRRLGPVGANGKPPRDEILDHPFLDLWNHPNDVMIGWTFRYLVSLYLDLPGECPVLVERPPVNPAKRRRDDLQPQGLWPIPPHWVLDFPRPSYPAWRVNFGGQIQDIPAGEVLWLCRPNPINPYGRGLGPAQVLTDELAQYEYATKWNSAFWRNGGRPGAIVAIPGMDESTEKRIQEQWNSDYQGVMNAFKTHFIGMTAEGGANVRSAFYDLSANQRESDFLGTLDHLRDVVMQAGFRVPPEQYGNPENSNRATIEGSEYVHQSRNLRPRANYQSECWGTYLLPLYGDRTLMFEAEDPVRATLEFTLQRASEGFKLGAITRNEWRQQNDFDMDPKHGDVYLTPMNTFEEGPHAQERPESTQQAAKRLALWLAGGAGEP